MVPKPSCGPRIWLFLPHFRQILVPSYLDWVNNSFLFELAWAKKLSSWFEERWSVIRYLYNIRTA